MRRLLEKTALGLLSYRMGKKAIEAELLPKYNLKPCVSLTDEEKSEIKNVWRDICDIKDFRSWELFKTHIHFDSLFIPDDIFVRYIIRVLNPIDKVYCLQNKNMYYQVYSDLNMPRIYANCINGIIYLPDGNMIGKEDLIASLNYDATKIFKPSSDTCSGEGVKKITNPHELDSALQSNIRNFVIQEYIEQSKLISRFNPSSLNTFRINTLYLNNNVSTINIMFRHGLDGAIVDNAGAGGIYSGVEIDGHFIGKSLDRNIKHHITTPFGERYSDLYIAQIPEMIKYVEKAHVKHLYMMGHVAWDVAIDKNNNPIVIEVNLGWPGIMTEQLSSCRPIYGDRTEEVIEYAKMNQSKMEFTDFLGHWT